MEHSLMCLVIGPASVQEFPWSISRPKGDSFAPEGPKAGSKKQRQETQDKEKGESNKEKGKGIFVLYGQRLPFDREEAELARRQMEGYTNKRGNPVLG